MNETITNTQSTPSTSDIEEEDDGYDVPFAMFTWKQWQEMQAQTMQNFTRFQRAIEHRQARLAMQIALQMQQIASEWIKEASSWWG